MRTKEVIQRTPPKNCQVNKYEEINCVYLSEKIWLVMLIQYPESRSVCIHCWRKLFSSAEATTREGSLSSEGTSLREAATDRSLLKCGGG